MDLHSLRESLVEHQKRKDELTEQLTSIFEQTTKLQKEYGEVMKEGQLIEGGILLLNKLIEQERTDESR